MLVAGRNRCGTAWKIAFDGCSVNGPASNQICERSVDVYCLGKVCGCLAGTSGIAAAAALAFSAEGAHVAVLDGNRAELRSLVSQLHWVRHIPLHDA